MNVRRLSWLKLLMPMSRRDRARLATLDDTQAGSKQTAEAMDKAVEVLELLAAALRDE